ncbi:MAG: hypothetical protein HKN23_16655 [Verrucomicrobiales bacterium]|nr:hypothetical protein [Verrucomicrobiales bacterium]
MEKQKIPTQFPLIVGIVVVVHVILAFYLFRQDAVEGPGIDSRSAAILPGATGSPVQHPLNSENRTSIAQNETGGDSNTPRESFSPEHNQNFVSRFPKRIPLQSELNGTVPLVSEGNAFELTSDSKESRTASKKPVFADLPSAVTAAKAAPFSGSKAESRAREVLEKEAAERIRRLTVPENPAVPKEKPATERPAATREEPVAIEPAPDPNPTPAAEKPAAANPNGEKPVTAVPRPEPAATSAREKPATSATSSDRSELRTIQPISNNR